MKKINIKLLVLLTLLLSHFIYTDVVASGINLQVSGKVNYFNDADSEFDIYTYNPDSQLKQWMNSHYLRMMTYAPYFDRRLDWYPNAWAYRNTYAIYKGGQLADDHPEWIMRDARGNKLYIPYGCRNGSCPQYAGDFSNPAFRRYMVEKLIKVVAKGYRGLWMDDVNMTWRVGNGSGSHVNPIDSSTGEAMTLTAWRRHLAVFMEEIRAALPNTEISHNVVWYSDLVENENPLIARQIEAADFITLERGGNDAGLKNGFGKYGYRSFLAFNDFIHNRGADVVIMDYGKTEENREYGLATWLLISEGKDLFHNNQREWTTPDSWWKGYELNLGQALGPRYMWGELIRRDFECGSVILNQPRIDTQSVNLGSWFINMEDELVSSVVLEAMSAAILRKPCDASVSTVSEDSSEVITEPLEPEFTIQGPTSVSFQKGVDGYTGAKDTMIDDSRPNTNFNSNSFIELDGSPRNTGSLMRWDVSSIPEGADVESVEISLYIANKSGQSYEIYEMKRPWVAEQATWNQYASNRDWSRAGAKGSADRGSDYLAKIRGTSQSRQLNVSLDENGIALIQSWVENPDLNNGLLFMDYSASDGLDFASSESSRVERRPRLTIKYSVD